MTVPFGVPEVLASALKRFSETEIRRVPARPYGVEMDFPRKDVVAIGGFTTGGIPIVVLVDMNTDQVFHAQKWEGKYQRLFS